MTKERVPIVDANGKQTHVWRNPFSKGNNKERVTGLGKPPAVDTSAAEAATRFPSVGDNPAPAKLATAYSMEQRFPDGGTEALGWAMAVELAKHLGVTDNYAKLQKEIMEADGNAPSIAQMIHTDLLKVLRVDSDATPDAYARLGLTDNEPPLGNISKKPEGLSTHRRKQYLDDL